MAATTPLYLTVHAVLLALLCSPLYAQTPTSCSGGNVKDNGQTPCVSLGASLISQGIPDGTSVKLTVYAYPIAADGPLTASVTTETLTDQLVIPGITVANRYMVYARLSASSQDSRPIGFAATHDEVSTTRDFWTNAANFMDLAQGSGAMKSRVTAKYVPGGLAFFLMFRSYNTNCYTGATAPASCQWTRLNGSNYDLSYGKYEFFVAGSQFSLVLIAAYPRVVDIGSLSSFYSTPTCESSDSGSGQTCLCNGAGLAVFNDSLCVPIGRVLREKGFKTDRDITLTLFVSPPNVFLTPPQPPRRVFQKAIRVTDDLILSELVPHAFNSLIDYENQNVYSTLAPVEGQVRNAIINQNTVATQSATANGVGLYTVTRTQLFSIFTMEYRAYSTACQGANATGDCQWLSFASQSHDLPAGTYELLPSVVGQYGYPPLMYTVGPSSGAPATAMLPSIFSLVCLAVLAIGLRLD